MTGFAQKLQAGGYRTHMVGKWDAGMATPEHTPLGRGYETWLGYYQHSNDYWRKNMPLDAAGEVDNCLNTLTDFANLSSAFHGGVRNAESLSAKCKTDPESDPACYEEHLFKERALAVINAHNLSATDAPLFLFYAFHLVHSPLEVPKAYLARIDSLVEQAGGKPFDTQNRRLLHAMVLYLDDVVGELVSALKQRSMWNDTLLVFLADNGGAVYEPGAGVNYPLKGGKYSDWEGGVKTNAFLSGGFIPESKRGTTFHGVVSVADWYATFAEFAGSDPTDHTAIEANKWLVNTSLPTLHPVDGIAQWKFILNGTNARSGPLHLSENAVLRWPYKLVTGKQPYSVWQGAVYPNCTTVSTYLNDQGPAFVDLELFDNPVSFTYREKAHDRLTWTQDCGDSGCLVNVEVDPNEHVNLAEDPAYAHLKDELKLTLVNLNKDLFEPDRGYQQLAACTTAMKTGGYYGPFVDASNWYTPVHLGVRERAKNAVLRKVLETVNNPKFEKGIATLADLVVPPFRSLLMNGAGSDKCLSPDNSAELLLV